MDLLNRTLLWLTDPAHWAGPNGIPARLLEHVGLSAVSLLLAVAIALPVGLWIGHTRRFTWVAVNSANLWRALPSLALIAMVLPITAAIDPQAGFKVYPTVVAMIVLAVPPVLVNTQAGITGVERDIVEAGRGQGMSEWQILTRVELPLAVPVIVAGIRSAAIQIVATATLGAILGFGGLGRYLVEGFATFSLGGDAEVVAGAILVGGLVLAVEALFAVFQYAITPRGLRRRATQSERSKTAAAA
jgi:osmoprotectant transport system permease protein